MATRMGVASNRYLELSATACGFAIRHVDYLSTRTMGFVRALPRDKGIEGQVEVEVIGCQRVVRRARSALVSLGRHENHSLEHEADLALCLRLSKG